MAGREGPWRIAITGATGLIGSALAAALTRRGHEVRRIVRASSTRSPKPGDISWDPERGALDPRALEGVHGVVHLAGESVGERWTDDRKARIRASRIQGTGLIAAVMAAMPSPPRVLVSASAIGYYGDTGDAVITETSPSGGDFLARVAREWEAATAPAARAGIRVVIVRSGIVLSPDGGALKKMLLPFRVGAGGKLASGHQWMSWIALTDEVAAIEFALRTDALSGPANLTAPHPVTNAEFTHTLGAVLGRPAIATVPAFVLRLMYGEMADTTLLAGQRVEPRALLDAGFTFRYTDLESALRSELG